MVKIVKAPSSGHEKRTVKRLMKSLEIDEPTDLKLGIELCTSSGSQYAKKVASNGGYSIRICLSRASPLLVKRKKKVDNRGRYSRTPLPVPQLVAGSVVSWNLNLSEEAHANAFLSWIRNLEVPPDVGLVELHSSTPCTGFSGIVNTRRDA